MKIKLHACKLCDASYASDQGLKVHIEAKHSGTPRPKSLCTQCGATFSTKYVLKAHVLEKHSDFKQVQIQTVNFFHDKKSIILPRHKADLLANPADESETIGSKAGFFLVFFR